MIAWSEISQGKQLACNTRLLETLLLAALFTDIVTQTGIIHASEELIVQPYRVLGLCCFCKPRCLAAFAAMTDGTAKHFEGRAPDKMLSQAWSTSTLDAGIAVVNGQQVKAEPHDEELCNLQAQLQDCLYGL